MLPIWNGCNIYDHNECNIITIAWIWVNCVPPKLHVMRGMVPMGVVLGGATEPLKDGA
jgi:hypothetical protein